MKSISTVKFAINNWNHLYSLQQAIAHNKQLTGRDLSINGRILNSTFLNHIDTTIRINFLQCDTPPDYPLVDKINYQLGSIKLENKHLATHISVDRNIFEELRKNLMEYADIDGIHIIVTVGVLSESKVWNEQQTLPIVQLDYAMQGDA